MAFTHVYTPDVALTGWAALQAGVGENAQRQAALAEQQRQFDAQLQQQELARQLDYARLGQQNDQFGRQLDQEGSQFNRTANQRDSQFGAELGQKQYEFGRTADQNAYQFDAGAYDKQQLERESNRFALLKQGLGGQQDLHNRLAEIDAQGQVQYGLHGLDDQARLQQEFLQQQGLNARGDQRAETQLEAARKTQVARILHDDWMAIQHDAINQTPEQYAQVVAQYKAKAAALGAPPPIDMPQPQRPGGQDPAEELQRLREAHPGYDFTLSPTGEAKVIVDPSKTPEAEQRKQDHAAQLKDKDIAARLETERMKQEAARAKESAIDQQKARDDWAKQEIAARQFALDKTEDGQPTLNQERYATEIEYRRRVFKDKHGYDPPVGGGGAGWGGQQSGGQRTDTGYQFSSPSELYKSPVWRNATTGTVITFLDGQGRRLQVTKR